jgi:hypothetical protein
VGVLIIGVLVFTVFCIVCNLFLLFRLCTRGCLICTSVRTTATE